MLLEVTNLFCKYNTREVLSNINFSVTEGEFVGIIGPNGSGKTTLIRALTRVLPLYSGKVIFNGRDISAMELKELARYIAVIPQHIQPALMKVEDFILLGRIPHYKKFQFFESRYDMEVVRRTLELTDTLKIKDRLLTEISGGERQLVLIARALTQEPKLLLLDEPTTYLDITHQVRILDLIKKLNQENGLTVVIVLHDLNMASEYCEKLMLFNNGRIYKSGTPADVLIPEIIKDVYKTGVIVKKNPVSSRPYIFVVSEFLSQSLKKSDN